jgi:hypothetical protein
MSTSSNPDQSKRMQIAKHFVVDAARLSVFGHGEGIWFLRLNSSAFAESARQDLRLLADQA